MPTPFIALSACLLVAPAPDPTPALADAIERVFSQMEQAVMAGDQQGYLALLDQTDPVFVQEHKNWAKDLERGLPLAFDMALVSEPTVLADRGTGDEVRAMVEMRYTPCSSQVEGNHEPRVIRYRARFVPAAGGDGAMDAAEPGGLSLLYAGEAWEVLEHGTTRVMFAPKWRDLASIVVEALPPIRAHVDAQTQSDNSQHIQVVKIYGDMQHLQASIYLSSVQGLSGWNEPREAIKFRAREARVMRLINWESKKFLSSMTAQPTAKAWRMSFTKKLPL